MKTGEMTIANFLDALAAKQPTPGGGGAAATASIRGKMACQQVLEIEL